MRTHSHQSVFNSNESTRRSTRRVLVLPSVGYLSFTTISKSKLSPCSILGLVIVLFSHLLFIYEDLQPLPFYDTKACTQERDNLAVLVRVCTLCCNMEISNPCCPKGRRCKCLHPGYRVLYRRWWLKHHQQQAQQLAPVAATVIGRVGFVAVSIPFRLSLLVLIRNKTVYKMKTKKIRGMI